MPFRYTGTSNVIVSSVSIFSQKHFVFVILN